MAIMSVSNKNSKQKPRGANQTSWIFLKLTCPIYSLSDSIPDTISIAQTDFDPEAVSGTITETNSDHSHGSTQLQAGGLRQQFCEAVGEHLSSQ